MAEPLYSIDVELSRLNVHDLDREYRIAYPEGTEHPDKFYRAMYILNSHHARRRLRETIPLLQKWLKVKFKNAQYDSQAGSIVGEDGYRLELMLRSHPLEPVAYDNQQTSTGTCAVYRHPVK